MIIDLDPGAVALLSCAVPRPRGLDGYMVSFALASDGNSLFVSRTRLIVAGLFLSALGGLCFTAGFKAHLREPLPHLLVGLGLFVLLPMVFLGYWDYRFRGTPLLRLTDESVAVGSREIPNGSVGGWLLAHSSRGFTWPGGTPAKGEHALSALFLVMAPPDANAGLLWISSQLDHASTGRIKRFLTNHGHTVREFTLDTADGASGFAEVLASISGTRGTRAAERPRV